MPILIKHWSVSHSHFMFSRFKHTHVLANITQFLNTTKYPDMTVYVTDGLMINVGRVVERDLCRKKKNTIIIRRFNN